MTYRRLGLAAVAAAAVFAAVACRQLGFTNRVLLRVPSPDGTLVAVCQEIPEVDGPSYDVRLERPDGARIRQVLRAGDGDPCSEIVWSPDGGKLAVLSGHVARVKVVDVSEALARPAASAPVRQIDFSWNGELRLGRNLRFDGPQHVELTTCPYSIAETQRTHTMRCLSNDVRQRSEVHHHPAGS